MADFTLREYIRNEGRLIIDAPSFDFDTFPAVGEKLVSLLSARVIEKQCDADLHSWLIDFEDCRLMLKAEHYSETLWLEALGASESREELDYLAGLLQRGI